MEPSTAIDMGDRRLWVVVERWGSCWLAFDEHLGSILLGDFLMNSGKCWNQQGYDCKFFFGGGPKNVQTYPGEKCCLEEGSNAPHHLLSANISVLQGMLECTKAEMHRWIDRKIDRHTDNIDACMHTYIHIHAWGGHNEKSDFIMGSEIFHPPLPNLVRFVFSWGAKLGFSLMISIQKCII